MNPQDRKVEDFAYEEEVHLSNCPLQEVAKEYGKDTNVRSKCDTCANNTDADEIDNGCYMCCKGLEDNYEPIEQMGE